MPAVEIEKRPDQRPGRLLSRIAGRDMCSRHEWWSETRVALYGVATRNRLAKMSGRKKMGRGNRDRVSVMSDAEASQVATTHQGSESTAA